MSPPPSPDGNVLPPPPDPHLAVAAAIANRHPRAEVRASLRRREIGRRALLPPADQDPVVGRLFVADCVRDMQNRRSTPPSIAIQLPTLRAHPKLRISGLGPRQRALVTSWWP